MFTSSNERQEVTLEGANDEFLVSRLAEIEAPEIRSIGVGGSRAKRGSADPYADLDLFILVRDGTVPEFIRRLPDLLNSLGSPLLVRGPVFVPNYGHSVTVIFAPAVCCQFNINDESTLQPHHCRKHTRIVVDHDGFLTRVTRESAGLEIDRRQVFEDAAATFWHRAIDIVRDLKRQQHWMAVRHLSDARQQLLTFARLAAGRDPIDYYLVEKRIEEDLGVSDCAEFVAALPRYDADSIAECLKFVVTWVNNHAPGLAIRIGAHYPREAADNVSQLVRTLTERSRDE